MEYAIIAALVFGVVRFRGRHGRRSRALGSALRQSGVGVQPRYSPSAFAWYPSRRGRR